VLLLSPPFLSGFLLVVEVSQMRGRDGGLFLLLQLRLEIPDTRGIWTGKPSSAGGSESNRNLTVHVRVSAYVCVCAHQHSCEKQLKPACTFSQPFSE
jgi:hypothetical protein